MTREPKHWSDPPEPKQFERVTYFDRSYLIRRSSFESLASRMQMFPVEGPPKYELLGYELKPFGKEFFQMRVPMRRGDYVDSQLRTLLGSGNYVCLLEPRSP